MVQTNSTQSAKMCPNLHFQGEGEGAGGGSEQLNLKCQDLSKSAFLGVGGGGGGPDHLNPKCQGPKIEPKIVATGMCSASHSLSIKNFRPLVHPGQ